MAEDDSLMKYLKLYLSQPSHLNGTAFSSRKDLLDIFMLVMHFEGTEFYVSICYDCEKVWGMYKPV